MAAKFRAFLTVGALCAGCGQGPSFLSVSYHPLSKPRFTEGAAMAPLPLGAVKPRGWLRRQLEIQAAGLSGHIEEVWPDLGPNSAWRGGTGEAWERGPYYLDGLVPLAFLLEDKALLKKMQAWMDWNLESQRPDGSFGPWAARDWWPDMVFLKALDLYEQGSGDARVAPFRRRYLDYVEREIGKRRLDGWRERRRYDEFEDLVGPSDRWQFYRWMELGLAAWMEGKKGLAAQAMAQGYDWDAHFGRFKYTGKTSQGQVFLANHGVNNAMGIKAPAVMALIKGKPLAGAAWRPYATLHRWHGQANGSFGADEQLAGPSPSQGSETCAVVEEMASLEALCWLSGDARLAQGLERLAYNALPAAFDDAMWTRQYDQQVNQVLVSRDWRDFTNNKDAANLFGLDAEWGCCTANFHQGWPRFAASLWMATPDGGLACLSPAPCSVDVELPAGRVGIEVEGNYPFGASVQLKLKLDKPAEFPLKIRRGEAWEVHRKLWKDGDTLALEPPLRPRARAWGEGLIIERGPILMALEVEAETVLLGKDPWSDRELRPRGPWAVAPLARPGQELPEAAPGEGFLAAGAMSLELPVRRVAGWEMLRASAGPFPARPRGEGGPFKARFIPYGAAKLRVAVFPLLR